MTQSVLRDFEYDLICSQSGVRLDSFVSEKTISACFYEAEKNKTAVPVIPIIDSLREKVSENESHPVDRSRFYAVQTPQVFTAPLLLKAYQQPFDQRFTDDASVVEAEGATIHLVEGNRENIKITTPFDLIIAKALLPE